MTDTAETAKEWIDGFLFVGNHASLDFLNTRLMNAEGPVELLPDIDALSRWLIVSGLLPDPAAVATVRAWHDSRTAKEFLREVIKFREQLRSAVLRFEAGKVPEQFIGELNEKLLFFPRRHILRRAGREIERKSYLDLEKPEVLWSEFAGSASDLFTQVPFSRVRKCEGCVVNFYDVSKKGSRRWCSMHMCGNRGKVATYRRKLRRVRMKPAAPPAP